MDGGSDEPPSLAGQLSQLICLSGLVALFVLGCRAKAASWLKESNHFYLEGIKRDCLPGRLGQFGFAALPSAAAYDLGGASLLVGIQHVLGLLLCLPEVTRSVGKA
ncbi:unnamed protein product, partial [Effrenium voratum]